jgi:POT family proton-dependent oligopeptide transporter
MEVSGDVAINVADALSRYSEVFLFSAKIGIGAGIVVLLLTPLVNRLMHGVR